MVVLMNTAPNLDFNDRFNFAIAYLQNRWDERDGFLSDSDVLDAAEAWTTDDLSWLGSLDVMPSDEWVEAHTADYGRLKEALFAHLTDQSSD